MSKKSSQPRSNRKLSLQSLEGRRLMAGDMALPFFGDGLFEAMSHPRAGGEEYALHTAHHSPLKASDNGMFGATEIGGSSQLQFGNDMLGGGLWMDGPSTINLGGFGAMPIFESMPIDSSSGVLQEAIQLDVFDGDATREEIAEALGVPLNEIEFVDASNDLAAIEPELSESDFANDPPSEQLAESPGDPADAQGMINQYEGSDFGAGVFDFDASPEDIAAALGVPLSEIEFIDAFGESESENLEDADLEQAYFDVFTGQHESNGHGFSIGVEEFTPQDLAQAELDQFDLDGDGLVIADEVTSVYANAYGLREAAASGAANGLIGKFDTNQDNALDLTELIVSYNHEAAQAEVELLDLDGDSGISSDEFAEFYLAMDLRDAAANGAAEGMVQTYDTNEDGVIDVDELTASYPVELAGTEDDSTSEGDSNEMESGDAEAPRIKEAELVDLAEDATLEEVVKAISPSDAILIAFEDSAVTTDAVEIGLGPDGTPVEIARVPIAPTLIAIEDGAIGITDAVEMDAGPDATPAVIADMVEAVGNSRFLADSGVIANNDAIEMDLGIDATLKEIAEALGESNESVVALDSINSDFIPGAFSFGFAAQDEAGELANLFDLEMGKIVNSMPEKSLGQWLEIGHPSLGGAVDDFFASYESEVNEEFDGQLADTLDYEVLTAFGSRF